MHPKKRRCTEPPSASAGQRGPGAQQPTGLSHTAVEVIDLTDDGPLQSTGASRHGFYNPENHTVTFPAPGFTSSEGSSAQLAQDLWAQEEASLQLAQQLQAQENQVFMQHVAPSTSQSPHPAAAVANQSLAQPMQAHLEGSFTPTDAFVESDEAIARELQAQFQAEISQETMATAGPSGWALEQASALAATEEEALPSQATSSGHGDDEQALGSDDDEPREAAQDSNLSSGTVSAHGFARHMAGVRCGSCRIGFFRAESDVVKTFRRVMDEDGGLRSCLNCTSCRTTICLGCQVRPFKQKVMTEVTVKKIKVAWCCDQGRLFLIWLLLSGLDHQHACESRRNNYFRQNCARPTNRQGGVGYGDHCSHKASHRLCSRAGAGIGLGPRSKADEAAARNDLLMHRVFLSLAVLLPTLEGDSDFDLNPPSDVIAMLLDSVVLDKAAELLRNDSLADATARLALYESVLNFVRRVGSHPLTANAAVHLERSRKPEGVDLLKLSFGTAPVSKGKGKGKGKGKDEDDKMQSIASCLGNLNTVSNMMLKRAKSNEEDFRGTDSEQMLLLCRRISSLAGFLLANGRPAQKSVGVGGGDGTNEVATWKQWQEENCLLELEDDQMLAVHSYANQATLPQTPAAGRMKRLMVDMTHLKTGLPEGIFVRHGSSRLDIMKVLIVGPGGSPYEGGLFEFDLLCPADYPNSPPMMHFRTTGGGRARINPNLYQDGKVCLSLLGTWEGESWQPGKSTVLQVLLSIQAMIFCDEPWCNEPGREGQTGSEASKSYNTTVQVMTMRHAILEWFQYGHHTIWKDVVAEYFKNCSPTIRNKVTEWLKQSLTSVPVAPYATTTGRITPKEETDMMLWLDHYCRMVLAPVATTA